MDDGGNYISAVYRPTSSTETTQLTAKVTSDYTDFFKISQIKTMYIDDVELDSIVRTYTFSDTNEHIVKFGH
jgi:hypothetical protein